MAEELEPHGVDVFVEIPKGSRNKYEWDAAHGRLRLDRRLFTSVQYPGDYGFVVDTWAEDDDPLDALIVLSEATFPGCLVRGRIVGVFRMIDDGEPDHKVITVPANDPTWAGVTELEDVPAHLRDEISHFFSIYKDLERKRTEAHGYGSRAEALELVAADRARFEALDPSPPMP